MKNLKKIKREQSVDCSKRCYKLLFLFILFFIFFSELFFLCESTLPTTEAGITKDVKRREYPIEYPEGGNGIHDIQKTITAVMSPDKAPEAIPSPENLTAAIPPAIAERYSAHNESGCVTASGSEVE